MGQSRKKVQVSKLDVDFVEENILRARSLRHLSRLKSKNETNSGEITLNSVNDSDGLTWNNMAGIRQNSLLLLRLISLTNFVS